MSVRYLFIATQSDAAKKLIFLCQKCTKTHYFTPNTSIIFWEGHSPLPRPYPIGEYGASTPRLRRGLDAFGVEVSAPSAPRPPLLFLNSTADSEACNFSLAVLILYNIVRLCNFACLVILLKSTEIRKNGR